MDLSIIIVNFNVKELLRQCLQSLQSIDSKNRRLNRTINNQQLTIEIFVVDNASSDGSVEMVRKEFPEVKMIANKENLGFAKANNQGIRESRGRFILLLNPDTTVPEGTLPEMLWFMEQNPKVGASTCFVGLSLGGIDWACHRGFPTPWASFTYFSGLERLFLYSKLFGQYHQTWKDLSQPHEIDSPVGSFYLVRREVTERVGLLDEDYFMYAEDLDWSYRIKKAGFKVMFYPKVKIIHYKGISSGMKKETQELTTANQETKMRSTEAFFETMKLFYKKHYTDKYPHWLMSVTFLGIDLLKWWRLRGLQ